jgi:hypothetical protein
MHSKEQDFASLCAGSCLPIGKGFFLGKGKSSDIESLFYEAT